jgi:hypothetical protein
VSIVWDTYRERWGYFGVNAKLSGCSPLDSKLLPIGVAFSPSALDANAALGFHWPRAVKDNLYCVLEPWLKSYVLENFNRHQFDIEFYLNQE